MSSHPSTYTRRPRRLFAARHRPGAAGGGGEKRAGGAFFFILGVGRLNVCMNACVRLRFFPQPIYPPILFCQMIIVHRYEIVCVRFVLTYPPIPNHK